MAKTKLSTVKKRAFVATIISYVISGFSFLFGLVIALLSIINESVKFINADVDNSFYLFIKNDGRWYGLLFIALGAAIFAITAYLTSKKSDKSEKLEKTKKARVSLNLDSIENKEESAN